MARSSRRSGSGAAVCASVVAFHIPGVAYGCNRRVADVFSRCARTQACRLVYAGDFSRRRQGGCYQKGGGEGVPVPGMRHGVGVYGFLGHACQFLARHR